MYVVKEPLGFGHSPTPPPLELLLWERGRREVPTLLGTALIVTPRSQHMSQCRAGLCLTFLYPARAGWVLEWAGDRELSSQFWQVSLRAYGLSLDSLWTGCRGGVTRWETVGRWQYPHGEVPACAWADWGFLGVCVYGYRWSCISCLSIRPGTHMVRISRLLLWEWG